MEALTTRGSPLPPSFGPNSNKTNVQDDCVANSNSKEDSGRFRELFQQGPSAERCTENQDRRRCPGAPTVLFDQVADSKSLAERAWVAWPKLGEDWVYSSCMA
jgi:hypothetical protein